MSSTVVAQWRNGFPAIIEHPLGKGWAVVVTTPVSQAADDPQAWNILATGFEPWPFVMLANESVLYSIDRSERRMSSQEILLPFESIVKESQTPLSKRQKEMNSQFLSILARRSSPSLQLKKRATIQFVPAQRTMVLPPD